jgi:DNA repair photolyase
MSKVIMSVTVEHDMYEMFKARAKDNNESMSRAVSRLIDESLHFSKEKGEKEVENMEKIYKSMEEETREKDERYKKMTPEERALQEHYNKCADLRYQGHTITDAMLHGEEPLPA